MRRNHFLILFIFIAAALVLAASDNPPPTPAPPELQAELSNAFTRRLQSAPATQSLVLELFTPEIDTAFTTPDGKTAVLWLALRDEYGHLLASEPGLALARLTDAGWQVLLPGDPGWDETMATLPDEMLPLEQLPAPTGIATSTAGTQALTGYYLPYAAGTARHLEGSIAHFQDIPELGYPSCANWYECRYAYDFSDAGHFPLLASKDGTVYKTPRDSCSDGNTYCTNYIVIRDTSGQTYQIYIHLAYGTIPNNLTDGAAVKRGQYLGDTDDTGYSTSNHVHFMVTNSIYLGGPTYDRYYWGQSTDVRFADVPINNGIPRTCYEVVYFNPYDGATECMGDKSDPHNPANDWFVSGNVGAFPPGGTLTRPAPGVTVAPGDNLLMDVTAYPTDDVHIEAVRLVAKLNGQWVEIGPTVTQPELPGKYDWDVNLCDVAPLNGPLDVALRAWDHEGNVSLALDPRTINVDHSCPPPTSQLNPAETFDSTAVRLSWNSYSTYAPIGSFDLQWRTEPGVWEAGNILSFPAYQRSTWFAGQPGRSYGFRVRAVDVNGQPEPWPAGDAAEIVVTLPASCVADAYEPDDKPNQAQILTLGGASQGNLCGVSNPDWFQVEVPIAGTYLVSAPSLSGGAAVRLTVYAANGQTVLASNAAAGVAQPAYVRFKAEASGSYYIVVEPLTADLMGTGAIYGVSVMEVKETFLPVVAR